MQNFHRILAGLLAIFLSTLAIAAEPSTPYTLTPLIQPGSTNLISSDFKTWEIHDDAHPATIDGKPALQLGPKQKNKASGFQLSAPAKPNVLYELTFRYRVTADLQWDYADDNAGLDGWLVAKGNNKALHETHLSSLAKPMQWRQFRTFLYTPAGTDSLSWQCVFNATAGNLLLTEPILREAAITESENRQLLTCNNIPFAELPRQEEPAAPKSLTLFHRGDPDTLFFYSHPRPDDITRAIQLNATAGEVAIAAIGIYTPVAATLHIEPTALTTADGQKLASMPIACPIRFAPRRNDYYGRGATWHWVADSLSAPAETISTTANQTQVVWLRLAIPDRAAAGDYSGQVVIKIAGQPDAKLPITLHVYPFQLIQPQDKTFGLYTDADRWKAMTDAQITAELADIKAHGIDSLLLPDDLGQPQIKNNTVTGWDWSPLMLRAMPLVQKANLRGPFRLWLERLPQSLAKKMNLTLDEKSAEAWPDSLAVAFRKTLQLISADFAARNWGTCVFEGLDEPGYWKKGSPSLFAWQYKNAHDAGIPTYCSSSYLPADPLGKFLDYHCYAGRTFDGPERSATIIEATHKANQKAWLYATGSYSGQIGNLIRNRYGSGFIFYRTGADGLISWTFQRPRGDPANDFADRIYQSFITYPDPQNAGSSLDTPQWEGLRQGWLDFRYAATTAAAIAAATQNKNPAAIEAQKEFDALMKKMPWDGTIFEDIAITNDDCNLWRSQLAAIIIKLTK